jgi:hypothetical protein
MKRLAQARPSPSMVVALLNADFAAGQVPAGPKGDKGDTGQTGETGQTGQTGQTGPPGPYPDPLQSGKTLRGTYAIDFEAGAAGEAERDNISFGFTLASNPTPVLRAPGAAATGECPGSAANPQAAPGILCVYQSYRSNVALAECVAEVATQFTDCGQSSRFGTSFYSTAATAGRSVNQGTWAVTAP